MPPKIVFLPAYLREPAKQALARIAAERLMRPGGLYLARRLTDDHQAGVSIAGKNRRPLNRIACQRTALTGPDLQLNQIEIVCHWRKRAANAGD